jgi:hypothetical protein
MLTAVHRLAQSIKMVHVFTVLIVIVVFGAIAALFDG